MSKLLTHTKLGLHHLVSELEASLNALEEGLPQAFHNRWYTHWGRLEEVLALNMEHKHREEIIENVRALESLLNEVLKNATLDVQYSSLQ